MTASALRAAARALAAAVCALLAAAGSAVAHEDDGQPGGGLDFTRAPADTLPWGWLSKVGVRSVHGRLVPEFLPPLRALDRTRVTLYGHATPVGAGASAPKQRLFLLTPRPLRCAGCEAPPGPHEIVEVRLKKPIAPPALPVAVRGTLHLLASDPQDLFYRLDGASVVAAPRATSRTPAADRRTP